MNIERVLSSTNTNTTSSFSLNAVDLVILLVCFAVLIITITIGSIYCKRRKEILEKQRKRKGIDIGKEKITTGDIQVDKEKSDIRRISNLNADTESKKNSHVTSKNSESSFSLTNQNSNVNENTVDMHLNKEAVPNQSSKLLMSKDTANSITSDSVVISIARSDKQLLNSENSTASYPKFNKKDDPVPKSDYLNFNELDFPIRYSKRRPTLIPSGKIIKKNTKESNDSAGFQDIVSFKVNTVKTVSQSGSDKISSNENNESKNSKEKNKFVFRHLEHYESENNKIESDSEDDKNINKHEETKKQGQSLMKMFIKYEDNILDPIVHKEKYDIPKEKNLVLRKESVLESQKTNDEIGFERSYNINKNDKSKNIIINKPIEESIIISDPKEDLLSFQNKYLLKKDSIKKRDIKSYFEEDSMNQANIRYKKRKSTNIGDKFQTSEE